MSGNILSLYYLLFGGNFMISKFSPTSKVLAISLVLGIALASILNFTSKPEIPSSGISEARAKELGYKDPQDLIQSNTDLGNAYDRAKENKFQLTSQDAQIFINAIKTGSDGSKNLATMFLGRIVSSAKEMPDGVREAFAEASKSPSSKVRLGIVMGLRGTNDPKLRQIFTNLQNDPDPEVRTEVTNFLKEEQISKRK
jgi:hypothetical protein